MAASALPDHEWDNDGALILTGSANAYVASTARKIKGYYKGLRICGRANFTNTGAATITVDEAGAVAIRKTGNVALIGGEIINGGYYDFIYDDANSVMQVGTAAQLPLSVSGDRWGVMPYVDSGGVMEIGRYIDFHNSDADATDNANRLETNGGTVGLYETPSGGVLKRIVSLINSTLAQGDITYFDGTNFVRLAPGTSGQFLKTNGAAANPAWADVSAVLLASGTVSAAATLDIVLTAFTSYRALKFMLTSFVPVTDDVELWMRFSTNGGSSYDAGATDYSYAFARTTSNAAGVTGEFSDGDTKISIAAVGVAAFSISNVANEGGANVEITLHNQAAARFTSAKFATAFYSATPRTIVTDGSGHRRTAQDTDAVRFLFESGNIASGIYAVYGLV